MEKNLKSANVDGNNMRHFIWVILLVFIITHRLTFDLCDLTQIWSLRVPVHPSRLARINQSKSNPPKIQSKLRWSRKSRPNRPRPNFKGNPVCQTTGSRQGGAKQVSNHQLTSKVSRKPTQKKLYQERIGKKDDKFNSQAPYLTCLTRRLSRFAILNNAAFSENS